MDKPRTTVKRFVLGGTGVAAIATAALIFASTGSNAAPTGSMTTGQIKSLVMTTAARLGDSTPTDISYSAPVTRNAANAASGDGAIIGGADGSASGYILVVAHGHFTAYDAITPPGDNNYPTGTVMIMVVDASTGQPTDSGIQRNTPDMSKVGPVTAIASN
jgi:hypothetical protein